MARTPNSKGKNREVKPKLDPYLYACLVVLSGKGFGANPTEVAKYLITRGIDDLRRANQLREEEVPPQ